MTVIKQLFELIVLFILVFVFSQMSAGMTWNLVSDELFQNYSNSMSNSDFVVLFTLAAAPFAEEVIMRMLLFSCFKKAMPFWPACIFSSLVFAASHMTIVHILSAFLFGMFLCIVFEFTGKLRYVFGFHSLYNALTFIYGGYLFGISSNVFMYFVTSAGYAVCILLLACFWKRIHGRVTVS